MNTGQFKKLSLFETICNISTGFLISYMVTMLLLPHIETQGMTHLTGFLLTGVYTITSFIRSYVWRRTFNYFLERKEYV